MSYITWYTNSGSLGTIPETQFYRFQLYAVSNSGSPVVYSFLSGSLPPGIEIIQRDVVNGTGTVIIPAGTLQGVPVINRSTETTVKYVFTIRATDTNGAVADRSFTLSVSNINAVEIIVPNDFVGAYFDGTYIEYKFNSSQTNSNAVLVWSVAAGELPPGLSLSSDGVLSGYADPIASTINSDGFDTNLSDITQYDPVQLSVDKYFNFTVQLFDGNNYTTKDVKIWIISKARFSADNNLTNVNNTYIPVDTDNVYVPIITSNPAAIPNLVQNSNFAYKFQGYDIEGYPLTWELLVQDVYGFDQIPFDYTDTNGVVYKFDQGLQSLPANVSINPNTGWLTGILPSQTETQKSYDFSVVASKTVEYSFITANITTSNANILVSRIPSNLSVGDLLTGITPPVNAIAFYKNDILNTSQYEVIEVNSPVHITPNQPITYNKNYSSLPKNFSITVFKNANDIVTWTSPANIGTIQNGAVSELSVSAVRSNGETNLVYSLIDEPYARLPNGIKLLPSGRLVGRASFEYFSLDSTSAKITVSSVLNLSNGMSVTGPGVASGCTIIAIDQVNDIIVVSPSIFVAQGTELVISNTNGNQYTVTVVSNSQSTTIDGGATTFDNTYRFGVQAVTADGAISTTNNFTLTVQNYNLGPYENVYLKALTTADQRQQFQNIVTDNDIFPRELIYRPDDPWFGIAKEIKFLFLAGLHPSTAATFIDAIQKNHYNKRINFGDINVARAVDANFNVKYEVVYVNVIDDQSINDMGPGLEIFMKNNPYLYGLNSYNAFYPNSFPNMQTRLESIGYTNRGALPGWMTSPQTNGKILGLTRAVVLAYVVPGAGNLIAYRLKNKNVTFNEINFVADRYQWDNGLSTNYNLATNSFYNKANATTNVVIAATTFSLGSQTTFDNLLKDAALDTFTDYITNSVVGTGGTTTFNITTSLNIGYGWSVTSVDTNSSIPDGTTVIAVNGTAITVNANITAVTGAKIEISGSATVNYAVTESFENINGRLVSELRKNLRIDGQSSFFPGQTLIFAQQENFELTYGGNNGWNNYRDPFDSNNFDAVEYSQTNTVPGYLDKLSGANAVNQQAGVWRIDFTGTGIDQVVTLTFVQEIIVGQQVIVQSGVNYPQTTLFYDISLGETRTVPAYSIVVAKVAAKTTFDGNGTKFISHRDSYAAPGALDKYIKFPQIGVFR
jgi:hypothetical protein